MIGAMAESRMVERSMLIGDVDRDAAQVCDEVGASQRSGGCRHAGPAVCRVRQRTVIVPSYDISPSPPSLSQGRTFLAPL